MVFSSRLVTNRILMFLLAKLPQTKTVTSSPKENLLKPIYRAFSQQEMYKTTSTDKRLQQQVLVVWQPQMLNVIYQNQNNSFENLSLHIFRRRIRECNAVFGIVLHFQIPFYWEFSSRNILGKPHRMLFNRSFFVLFY